MPDKKTEDLHPPFFFTFS